jgi:hypothetical protein
MLERFRLVGESTTNRLQGKGAFPANSNDKIYVYHGGIQESFGDQQLEYSTKLRRTIEH